MSSVKKLMCNPPAESVASNGDHKVAGMFRGAGKAIDYLESGPVRDEFAKRVLDIEMNYMDKRKQLESDTEAAMQAQFDWLVAKTEGVDKDMDKDKSKDRDRDKDRDNNKD